MCGLGTWELLVILGIVLLLFGAKKLPELAKGLGGAVRELKKSASEPAEIDGSSDADGAPLAKTTTAASERGASTERAAKQDHEEGDRGETSGSPRGKDA